MTEQQHPITPPPELVQQWRNAAPPLGLNRENWIATQAARWGADQELDACVEWLRNDPVTHEIVGREARYLDFDLYGDRRPKPPSLAEQALKALQDQIDTSFKLSSKAQERVDLICAALERLQELENND